MRDADGAVLLDLKGGRYYSLNGVGAEIWDHLERGAEAGEILRYLCEAYDLENELLERDLDKFLTALEVKGLIRRELEGVAR